MRKAIIGLLLAATAATPALAQNWDRGGDRREARQNQREIRQGQREVARDRAQVRNEVRQGDWQGARQAQRELRQDQRQLQQDRREAVRDRQAVRNGTSNGWAERQRDIREDRRDDLRDRRDRFDGNRNWNDRNRNWNDGRRDYGWNDRRGSDRGGWNNGWRNDRRYDWQYYRNQNRNLYRLPRYYAPRGYSYGYRRWSPGYRVEPFWYGSSYWINDPWLYRLPPAYGDYRWVRYYDDVALIDVRTGIILDIIYSFFW